MTSAYHDNYAPSMPFQCHTPPYAIILPPAPKDPWPYDEMPPAGMVDDIEILAYNFHPDGQIARSLGLSAKRVTALRKMRRNGEI